LIENTDKLFKKSR